VRQHVGEEAVSEVTLRLYPGSGSRESLLYEDAGEGMAYRDGDWMLRRFVLEAGGGKGRLRQTVEGAFVSPVNVLWLEWVDEATAVRRVSVDGRAAEVVRSPEGVSRARVDAGFREAVWDA
jgi:hypothetical protein